MKDRGKKQKAAGNSGNKIKVKKAADVHFYGHPLNLFCAALFCAALFCAALFCAIPHTAWSYAKNLFKRPSKGVYIVISHSNVQLIEADIRFPD